VSSAGPPLSGGLNMSVWVVAALVSRASRSVFVRSSFEPALFRGNDSR
jgi:hypothetical protein